MTNSNKQKPEQKQNRVDQKKHNRMQQKMLLRQTIKTFGIDGLLYPSLPEGARHPYTQEILLFADEQGWIQKEIAECCKVSQSVVSGWENGEGKAELNQLMPLIKALSPFAPGKKYWVVPVIKELPSITLTDDWEVKALAKACKLSESEFLENLKRSLELEIEQELKGIDTKTQNELNEIDEKISSIEKHYQNCLKEKEENNLETDRYENELNTLLEENKAYKELSEQDLQAILKTKLQPANISNNHEDAYLEIQQEYEFNDENRISFIEQLQNQKGELQKTHEQLETKRKELEIELHPLNKYQKEHFPLTILADVSGVVTDESLAKELEKIFTNKESYNFQLFKRYRDPYYGYKEGFVKQNISCKDMLRNFLEEQSFPCEVKDIHLCGEHITSFTRFESVEIETPYFTSTDEVDHDTYHSVGTNSKRYDLIQLYTNRIGLVVGTYNFTDKEYRNQIHIFNTLDDLINFLNDDSEFNAVDDWKELLMSRGYITSTAELIY